MNITAVNSFGSALSKASGVAQASSVDLAGPADSSESFAETISNTVKSLDAGQQGAELEIARAVAGESPDLHRTIIALQSADLSFQLGLQVRNKLIGAYEEIMRMQV